MTRFRLPERKATLVLEDTELIGLEVTAIISVPTAALLDIDTSAKAGTSAGIRRAVEGFVAVAKPEWNLDDADGKPVPATAAGMMTLPPNILTAVLTAWGEACSGVAAPLGSQSGDGSTSEEPQE